MFSEYHTILKLRIDWSDLDLFGHVNNVAFFKYIQAARVNYCGRIGLDVLQQADRGFIVASTACQFKTPLKFPGEIDVYTKIDLVKNSSFQLQHLITDEQKNVFAEGSDVLLFYDHINHTKKLVDAQLLNMMEDIECRELKGT